MASSAVVEAAIETHGENRQGNVAMIGDGATKQEALSFGSPTTVESRTGKELLVVGDDRTKITQIDRHNATRQVPLKVLCLGLGRTGTNSLRHALFMLGYDDVYHFSSLFENPPDLDMWLEAIKAKYGDKPRSYSDRDWDRLRNDSDNKMSAEVWGVEQWDQLLGHCMAVSDLPVLMFIPELLEAYPDAKLLLTVRGPDAWYISYLNTLHAWHWRRSIPRGPFVAARRWLSSSSWPLYAPTTLDQVSEAICRNGPHVEFPEKGLQWYHEHNDMVRRLAREQGREVLEFDCRQGWEPLCEFLGHDVPSEPFPRVNDTKSFMALTTYLNGMEDRVMWRNLTILTAAAASVCAGAFAWWRR